MPKSDRKDRTSTPSVPRLPNGFLSNLDSEQFLIKLESDTSIYTYAVAEVVTQTIKIGKTIGHPLLRMRDLQVGCPLVLSLLAWTIHISEKEAHRYLKSYKLRGEWFVVSNYVLDYINTWEWVAINLYQGLREHAKTREFDS